MKCNNCGTEFDNAFSFCPNCGSSKDTRKMCEPSTLYPQMPPESTMGVSGEKIKNSLQSFGIASIIILIIAVIVLLNGYLISAVIIGAAGVCLCKFVRPKIPMGKMGIYVIVGVLLVGGLINLVAQNEDDDSNNTYFDSVDNAGTKKAANGEYYLGQTVQTSNWSITVNSVSVSTLMGVMVDCDCTVTNISDSNIGFYASDLFALDNNGMLDEAFSYDSNNVVLAGKSFDTQLTFVYSDNANTDTSLMNLYIGDPSTYVHLVYE